jgi:tripartite-type tricarboxylate transporter receptor subunit TctC
MITARFALLWILSPFIAYSGAAIGQTFNANQFYKDRQVSLIITGSPGSIYDMYARTLAHAMAKRIPGEPTIVPRSMVGGGHLVGTNYLYNVAAQDGSVIGSIGETMPLVQLLEPEQVKFDVSKFNWIGNPNVANLTLTVWGGKGFDSLQDAMTKTIVIGASGATSPSATTPTLLNSILGTKFKVINGFPANQLDIAMERGEIDGRGSAQWEWWKISRPQWVKEGKIKILMQMGPRKEPDLPDAPLLNDLARTTEERQVFALYSSTVLVGRPILLPPNVPADRVALWRQAFRDIVTDPAFLADAERMKLPMAPIYGEDMQQAITDIVRTPKHIIELSKAALEGQTVYNCVKGGSNLQSCMNTQKN